MTLLNATIVLLEAARCLPETEPLCHAIRRMEKRLEVLQARQAKAEKRRQRKCILSSKCPACAHQWPSAEEFLLLVRWRVNGGIAGFTCPKCNERWDNTL